MRLLDAAEGRLGTPVGDAQAISQAHGYTEGPQSGRPWADDIRHFSDAGGVLQKPL
jgi:hypothetical protein